MVTTEGQPLPLKDKAKILHKNELLPQQEHSSSVDHVDHNTKKVIGINWMALVNTVPKDRYEYTGVKLHFKKDALKLLNKVFILGLLQKKGLQECGQILV